MVMVVVRQYVQEMGNTVRAIMDGLSLFFFVFCLVFFFF